MQYFLVVLYTGCLSGQQIVQFHHLSTEDGLTSGKYNSYIHQDQMGYVWISSTAGFNRYDGKQVKVYHPDRNDRRSLLSDNSAQSRIAERTGGDLFFSTFVGYSRYNRATDDYDHYKIITSAGDTLRSSYLWCYLPPAEDHLFVSGGKQLFRLDPERPEVSELVDDKFVYLKDRMRCIGQDSFLLTHFRPEDPVIETVVYRVGWGKSGESILTTPGEVSINDVQIVGADSLLVATDRGLWGYNLSGERWSLYPGTDSLPVIEVEPYGDHSLYLASRSGNIFHYATETGLLSVLLNNTGSGIDTFQTGIERLTITADSTLWVGTVSSGVFHASLKRPAFSIHRLHRYGRSPDVLGFAEDGGEGLYVLYKDHVGWFGDGERRYYDLPVDGVGFNEVSGIFVDREDRLWVSTYSDLFYLDKGATAFQEYELQLANAPPYDAGFFAPSYLPNDDLLLPLNQGCAYVLKPGATASEPWLQQISRVRRAVFNNVGRGIVTSYEDSLHFVTYVGGQPRLDTSIIELGHVNGVAYDAGYDCFWVSSYAGLWRATYAGDWRLEAVDLGMEDVDKVISSLVLDRSGFVWFSTTRNIIRYDPRRHVTRMYGISDGLQSRDFNLGVAMVDRAGQVLMGGVEGFNRLEEKVGETSVDAGRLAITSIVINGDEQAYKSYTSVGAVTERLTALRLPFDQRDIEIGLSAFDYKDPTSVKMSYALSGAGATGIKRAVRSSGVIDLFNLSPGDYEIVWEGTDSNGQHYAMDKPFSLKIDPPWYRTWWAYLLYLITATGLIGGALRYRYQKMRAVELAELGEANARREATERELAMLRLQMDPHFVSNSLVSVQEFLQIGDPDDAEAYLVLFSRLIREVLERSVHPLTRLEDALDWLRRYVALEEKRLDAPLRFVVEGEEAIDAYATWIPTMILQPFVENAILHGIGNRASGGTVTVRYYHQQEGRGVVLEVEDDGRGRGSKVGDEEHTSMATDITRRRLLLLEKDDPAIIPASIPASTRLKALLKIVDLTDETGAPCGTRVLISLPWLSPK